MRLALIAALCAACATGCRTLPAPRTTTEAGAATLPATESEPVAPAEPSDEEAAGKVRLMSGEMDAAGANEVQRPAFVQLSLRQAIEMGLDQNPDLNVLRQNEGVGAAAFGVAATYPFNPFVQVQATPLQSQPGGGQGTVYHYVLLMQQIQLAHQQQFREESAGAALNTIRWNIRQAELLNVAQTERLFLTAMYLRDVHQLTRTIAASNAQLLRILERQLEAGQAAAADVAIVRLDARATRRQADLAEANYNTALLDLRRQLNLPAGTRIELIGSLLQWRWESATPDRLANCQALTATQSGPWAEQSLIEVLASGRPDVLAARSDVDVARANRSLANASRTPDVQVGPYYQRTIDGSSFFGFRAHTDLMIMNNGQPLVRQREAEMVQRTVLWQQLERRASLEIEASLDRYERARRLVDIEAVEQLPTELLRLEEQFKANEVDVLRVFQARNSLIGSQRALLDTLNEAAQAAANVTQFSGLPPEALINMTP